MGGKGKKRGKRYIRGGKREEKSEVVVKKKEIFP